MLEENQGQFWNLHQIPHKTSYPDFRFSSYFFFDDWRFSNKITISYLFLVQKKLKNEKREKKENRYTKFC